MGKAVREPVKVVVKPTPRARETPPKPPAPKPPVLRSNLVIPRPRGK